MLWISEFPGFTCLVEETEVDARTGASDSPSWSRQCRQDDTLETVGIGRYQSHNAHTGVLFIGIFTIGYPSGGEPMARVPKVACETISRGTPSLKNLPRNSGRILYFQKITTKFRE